MSKLVVVLAAVAAVGALVVLLLLLLPLLALVPGQHQNQEDPINPPPQNLQLVYLQC